MNLTIFVMDRGMVVVGTPAQDPRDFQRLVLSTPAIIRRWGTSQGLGQLAREGPQPNTQLDLEPEGTAINKRYIMREIPCHLEAWAPWLSTFPTTPAAGKR